MPTGFRKLLLPLVVLCLAVVPAPGCGEDLPPVGPEVKEAETDAGVPREDAGEPVDAGAVDAGPPDAGPEEPVIVCGDGRLGGDETCDDGNSRSGDGCDSDCHVEDGWVCPTPGIRCIAARCGDGKIAGAEQCDDGNAVDNDGCSSTCQLESAPADEGAGWMCPVPGQLCTRTVCGNGIVEGSEQCDDGNNNGGDGCTPFCRKEPTCPAAGGSCSTACGDGLLLPSDRAEGQECDDGNTLDGDGCSSTCKLERGFVCVDRAVEPDTLVLPLVLRDFNAHGSANGHPDFERYSGSGLPGIVEHKLGLDGKPVHVAAKTKDTTNNTPGDNVDWFDMWYRDTPAYNRTVVSSLSFGRQPGGEYQFSSSAFFPLDGLGWNEVIAGHNFGFTSEVRYWFQYQGGEQLDFTGDDDVWVFVNKRLAVDLGGLHSSASGSVILDARDGTGKVCDFVTRDCNARRTVNFLMELGKVYEIVVFQAERHSTGSNYRLTLSKFGGARSVCSSVCGDGIVTADEACDEGSATNDGRYGGCTSSCVRAAFCGDAKVNGPELCDDGFNVTVYRKDATGCAPGCVMPGYCGDGVVDKAFGETCDDGNIVNGDGCSSTCKREGGPK